MTRDFTLSLDSQGDVPPGKPFTLSIVGPAFEARDLVMRTEVREAFRDVKVDVGDGTIRIDGVNHSDRPMRFRAALRGKVRT